MNTAGRATAEAFWGAHTAECDERIRRLLPRYDEQLDALFAYLPDLRRACSSSAAVPATVAMRLAARWPPAGLTLVGAAPEMFELTHARLAARYPATATHARYIADYHYPAS